MLSLPEALFFLLMIIVMSLPFIPGGLELLKPRDIEPLAIDLNSSSDPRHQALTLANEIKTAAAAHHNTPGVYPSIEILTDQPVIDHNLSPTLFAPKNLRVTNSAKLNATAFANEEIVVEPGCRIDALLGEGNIYLQERASIGRFVDAAKELHIAEECQLGELASAAVAMHIRPRCYFKRLYSPTIEFTENPSEPHVSKQISALSPIDIGRFGWVVNRRKFIIPAESWIKQNIYTEQDLRVRHSVTIEGSIQCEGKVFLSEGAIIKGNIFAKDEIVISRNCKIYGNIFSQTSVNIDSGSTVGEKGKINSVIAKKEIKLHPGITIYGYVMTQGMGYVV